MALGQVTRPTTVTLQGGSWGSNPPDFILSLFSNFLPAFSIGSIYLGPTGHRSINAGHAGHPTPSPTPSPTPPKHRAQRREVDQENTQHDLQPPFLLQEQKKESHVGMTVTPSLTTRRAAKRKGVFQVAEPSSHSRRLWSPGLLTPDSVHLPLDPTVTPHLGRRWAESLGQRLAS